MASANGQIGSSTLEEAPEKHQQDSGEDDETEEPEEDDRRLPSGKRFAIEELV
jgi:hypothetical protein